ncbi:MAG: PIN domain-containing protein, partial [Gemmatimonadetes bacterium]|nr:PIN domain-containing protein [Gemmatimonadota bacterium]MDA1103868.1 PIN domain-containing protein [Gemmatimonadota bacterium]
PPPSVTSPKPPVNCCCTSNLMSQGPPRAVLDAWVEGRLEAILTPSIFDEYLRVCDRLRRSYPEADYQAMLTDLLAHGTLVPDVDHDESITADPDDDKFMLCALEAGAVVV